MAMGMLRRWCVGMFFLALAGFGTSSAWAADDGQWAAEMLQKRQALQRSWASQPHASAWSATASLPVGSFEASAFPEQGVDLAAKGANGKPLWTSKPRWNDGVAISLAQRGASAMYLFRTIEAPDALRINASFGSDDGITIWLNGKKIHANNAARGVDVNADHVALDLTKGTNRLLVRIYNQSGNSGFACSLGGSSAVAECDSVAAVFPAEVQRFQQYFPEWTAWFRQTDTSMERKAISGLLGQLKNKEPQKAQFDALVQRNAPASDPAWLTLFSSAAQRVASFQRAGEISKTVNFKALRLSIEHLKATYPQKYPNGQAYLDQLDTLEKQTAAFQKALAERDDQGVFAYVHACEELQRKALLIDNPLIDFDKLLLVKRDPARLGLPQNWQANTSINPQTDNEIDTLDIKTANAPLKTLYKPAQPVFVGDMNLHFDANKLLFSSIGANGRWQVFEMNTDGSGLNQVTPGTDNDIDNFNGIYLPDGRILFDSTATFVGVPCVGGADYVANLHLLSADRKNVRRICFEQDNDWYPTVMPDGRVMYLRWEYTDSAHYFSRILMTMNPDGTNQIEYYGSNSYWPNSTFYAKPVPGSSSKFVGIVTGHHGMPRMGSMILFDVGRGRQENNGAVQMIPGYGKPVVDKIEDGLYNDIWPRCLHPIPLSDKYFLVSCMPTPNSKWGIYLADAFDNLVLIRETPGAALLEPIPLRKVPTPPAIADKVDLKKKTATVALQNVYSGPGLAGVPHGTIKQLRLFQYEYSYRNMGGHYTVGIEGPWDVRRILGTVPVHEDGSALFEIPANTPVTLQPLDAEGKAIQQKRSWFVGMPGENVSCAGCHNPQNAATTLKTGQALQSRPAKPTPWYGPTRGFSFLREVQPVLDKFCVGCHDGSHPGRPNLAETKIVGTTLGGSFPKSYIDLHPYIRRNGPEGDYHLLTPGEFHADTSDLVQMLTKGHHNVKLDKEGWDRLITWIDLNVPAHGSWHEAGGIPGDFEKRRYELKKCQANVEEDIEAIVNPYKRTEKWIKPDPESAKPAAVAVPNWPFPADKAGQMQAEAGAGTASLDLGEGKTIQLKRIPAGEFEMGDLSGCADEYPTARVLIAKPFSMAVTEISLEQFQQFNPKHHNGYYDMHYKDQVKPGYLMDSPKLPVIRVSWQEAMEFCDWLSKKSGKKVTLPTEAQWEWACRAGTATPCWYGDLNSDFSKVANLGDRSLKRLAVQGVDPQPISNPDKFWDFVPKDDRFDDGVLHLADVGRYECNPWGLKDMHGNVAEWTRSTYRAYPYNAAQDVADDSPLAKKTVRGGSWYDRPMHARSAFRQNYPAWQKVYNVGIRIIVED